MSVIDLAFNDKLGISKEEQEIKNLIDKKSMRKYFNGSHYRPHTKVEIFSDKDGQVKLEWQGSNMMTLAGGGFLARSLFDFNDSVTEVTPSYNTALNLEKTIPSESAQTAPIKVFGFCVGNDGCGKEVSQVYAVKYASWIRPVWNEFNQGILPFQYRESDDDLTSEEREIYFGRKILPSFYAYYFKKFSSDPVFTQQYTDGTPIDSNVYDDSKDMDVETVVTMVLELTKSDCRGVFYYGQNGSTINDASWSSLSLVMGWPYVDADGYTYYQQIRPLTRINSPLNQLVDLRSSYTIRYSVYF